MAQMLCIKKSAIATLLLVDLSACRCIAFTSVRRSLQGILQSAKLS